MIVLHKMKGAQIIVLNTITYAYKARDYLQTKGIKSEIERIPAHLRLTGCGYGVRVRGDGEQIARLLADAGIRVMQILDI